MGFFQRIFGRPPASAAIAALLERQERYWELRRVFREAGVYEGVIIDVIPYGTFPVFQHNKRAEIVCIGEAGDLQHYSMAKDGRVVVAMQEVPYDEEPVMLARLKAALPDADYRAVWSSHDMDALRGYYAFRYPVSEDVVSIEEQAGVFPHDEYDPTCSADSNAQHMRYMLEGYRARVLDPHDENPYSPGSARAYSWQRGFDEAEKDLKG